MLNHTRDWDVRRHRIERYSDRTRVVRLVVEVLEAEWWLVIGDR
jgi:hypothetical protein